MMKHQFLPVLVAGLLLGSGLTFIPGCGNDASSTVIQPTVDYQPTAEEKAMQSEMDAAREGSQ